MFQSLDANPEKHVHLCVILIVWLIIVTLMGHSSTFSLSVLRHFARSGPSNEILSDFVQL